MTYLGKEVRNGKMTVISPIGNRHEFTQELCLQCQDVIPTDYPHICNSCVKDNMDALKYEAETQALFHGNKQ